MSRIVDVDLPIALVPLHTSRPLLSAFWAGALAAKEGTERSQNPYVDKRTSSGYITFARAYRNKWWQGYDAFTSSRPEERPHGR